VLVTSVAAAAVAAFGAGTASDGPAASNRSADTNGGVDRYEGWVACSRYIVVGDVVAVSAAPTKGRVVLSLAAQDWVKPSRGRTAVDLETLDPTGLDAPPLRPGEHVLVVMAAGEEGHIRTYPGRPTPRSQPRRRTRPHHGPVPVPRNRSIRSDV